jgi:hypothetical protein
VLALAAGPVAADVNRGEPDIEVYAPDNTVSPGSETVLELQVANDGDLDTGTQPDAVLTAKSVTARVSDDGPFDVRTSKQSVGTIPDGSSLPTSVELVVPEDVEPGTYEIDVQVSYTYTNYRSQQTLQRESDSVTRSVTIEVVDEPRFEITSVDSDVQPGTSGTADVTIRNVGSETARALRTTLTGSGGLTFDGGASRTFVGDLEPGENVTVDVDARLAASVGASDRPIEATFQYRSIDGLQRQAGPAVGSLSPVAEQSFAVDGVETTLSVGATGRVAGTVTNEGPTAVDDGVLVVTTGSERIALGEGQYALPALAPGESTNFSFDAEVSGQADPGPRQFGFVVEYTDGGAELRSDRETSRVEVEPRQPVFEVAANETIQAGGSTTLTVDITNNRAETLTDITANLYANSPLATGTDESFVDDLEPGETTTVQFELSAAGSAMPNTYSVEMDFQYTDSRGDERISEVAQLPVQVTESTDGDGSLSPLVVPVALLVGVALLRRR